MPGVQRYEARVPSLVSECRAVDLAGCVVAVRCAAAAADAERTAEALAQVAVWRRRRATRTCTRVLAAPPGHTPRCTWHHCGADRGSERGCDPAEEPRSSSGSPRSAPRSSAPSRRSSATTRPSSRASSPPSAATNGSRGFSRAWKTSAPNTPNCPSRRRTRPDKGRRRPISQPSPTNSNASSPKASRRRLRRSSGY